MDDVVVLVKGQSFHVLVQSFLVLFGSVVLISYIFDLLGSLLVGLNFAGPHFLGLLLPFSLHLLVIWHFIFEVVDHLPPAMLKSHVQRVFALYFLFDVGASLNQIFDEMEETFLGCQVQDGIAVGVFYFEVGAFVEKRFVDCLVVGVDCDDEGSHA